MELNDSPELEYINTNISQNTVVCFNKSWCPFCQKVENIFKENGIQFHSIYLDHMGDFGDGIQVKLEELTGQRTVPNVFINKNHVGGCSNILEKFADGTIYDLLNNVSCSYEYDLIAIGGGSGGLAAIKEASQFKKRVAVFDYVTPSPKGTTWGLGGTCVNVGCIPKKLMHRAALIHEDIEDAKDFGWELKDKGVKHDWRKLVHAIQDHIKSLNWNYRKQLRQKGVDYFNSIAKFKDEHTVEFQNSDGEIRTVTSRNFIIAVGGRPHYPDFPGSKEYCITSDDLFSLDTFPGKTLIIGGSYIALECAGFLNGLGVRSSVMVRSILLRGFDQSMANKVGKHMDSLGINFIYECIPTKVYPVGSKTKSLKVQGQFANGDVFEDVFDTVILATGRNACTEILGLDKINVATNPKNKKVIVDSYDRTSVKTIFAIGDAVDGKPELTPVAIQAGKFLARRLYSSSDIKMDWIFVPTTVFTPLEYGFVGLSEEDAATMYGKIEVYHSSFKPLEKVLSGKDSFCYAKLVCIAEKDKNLKVVGFHILGPNSGEITQGFALALKLGVTKKQFDSLIGIHPTCAEIFTNLTVTKSSGKDVSSTQC